MKKLQHWDKMCQLVAGNPVLQYHFQNQYAGTKLETKVDVIPLLCNERLKVRVKKKKKKKILTLAPKHLNQTLLSTCEMKPKPIYDQNPSSNARRSGPPPAVKVEKNKKKRCKNAGLIIPQEILNKRQKPNPVSNPPLKAFNNPFSNSKLRSLLDGADSNESGQSSNKLAAFLSR
ncbi:uncharacterized protein LOC131885723 [Tigriopus californicus]|uniref:uncharacterized protein LOC131885723 n=1 Tax=Tigriopus californicus TaxID=6832 RepID=UPI0027DA6609|nr:uncharacterized protein LOC131885723 [Tigriopus californicus]